MAREHKLAFNQVGGIEGCSRNTNLREKCCRLQETSPLCIFSTRFVSTEAARKASSGSLANAAMKYGFGECVNV